MVTFLEVRGIRSEGTPQRHELCKYLAFHHRKFAERVTITEFRDDVNQNACGGGTPENNLLYGSVTSPEIH